MNGEETLDWAKKPAVPDNRKRATIEGSPVSRFCPKCALEGSVNHIQLFQINDEEALLMCKNASCTFMQSTNWQSLIVKRSLSQLSASSRRKSLSSGSSQVSTSSNRNTGTRPERILKSAPQSRYSVPFSPASSAAISHLPSLAGVTVASSRRPVERFPISSVQQDSSLEGKERKTLVPIAPFLSGHAHSFASFETNRLEYKLQQRGAFLKGLSPSPAPQSKDFRTPFVTDKQNTEKTGKRRANSLDSDSLSSSSSCYDSRPTTPETPPVGKKVRSVVVPPETLSKLIDGSMKLEIRKSKDSGSDIILRSVKKVNSTNGYSKHPETETSHTTQKVNGPVPGDSVEPGNSDPTVSSIQNIFSSHRSSNLEITPVGSLHDIVSSGDSPPKSVGTHIEAINFHLQANSIKSHIEIINSHIQAINKAVGGSDLYIPLNFSQLCQKFSVGILEDAASTQGCDQISPVSTADLSSEFEKLDTSSSPVDCTYFTPVGYLDKQIFVPGQVSADNNSHTPGNVTVEGLPEITGS